MTPKMTKTTFLSARSASGMTQTETAELFGLTQTGVGKIERNEVKVKPAYIALLLAWSMLTPDQRREITDQL